MLGDGFLPTMQYEEYVSTIIRAVCDELGNGSDPLIYPGLMAAWESAPATVEFDGGASGFVNGGGLDIESVPLDGLEDIFPACLLFDIRPFGLSPYDLGAFEGLFVYPSYDLDRGYAVLLLMAVGLKKGLSFPLTSKIVVSGETFADALEASGAERRILERRCLSGLDSGLHDGLFSALDDEPEVCALAVRLLAAMCGNRSEVERTRTKKGLRLRVTLAADEDYLGAIQALPLSPNAPVMCISAASICQMVQLPFGSEGRFGSNSAPLVHYAYKHVVATLLRIPVPEQWSASRCFAYDKTQELYDEKRKRKGSKAPGRPAADLAEAAGKMILASLELAEEVDAAQHGRLDPGFEGRPEHLTVSIRRSLGLPSAARCKNGFHQHSRHYRSRRRRACVTRVPCLRA